MFQIDQAMDGDDALEYLDNAPLLPDLILLDVMMPGMNGYEVRYTKALPLSP
jgi:CheY-like chemotaxis protein